MFRSPSPQIAILRSFRVLFMANLIEAVKQLNERFLRLELGCLKPASTEESLIPKQVVGQRGGHRAQWGK